MASVLALGIVGVPAISGNAPASAQEDIKGYPSISVTDIKTGKSVNLSTLNATKLPTLAWFWAPH
jgi:hypothetical protein